MPTPAATAHSRSITPLSDAELARLAALVRYRQTWTAFAPDLDPATWRLFERLVQSEQVRRHA